MLTPARRPARTSPTSAYSTQRIRGPGPVANDLTGRPRRDEEHEQWDGKKELHAVPPLREHTRDRAVHEKRRQSEGRRAVAQSLGEGHPLYALSSVGARVQESLRQVLPN